MKPRLYFAYFVVIFWFFGSISRPLRHPTHLALPLNATRYPKWDNQPVTQTVMGVLWKRLIRFYWLTVTYN